VQFWVEKYLTSSSYILLPVMVAGVLALIFVVAVQVVEEEKVVAKTARLLTS